MLAGERNLIYEFTGWLYLSLSIFIMRLNFLLVARFSLLFARCSLFFRPSYVMKLRKNTIKNVWINVLVASAKILGHKWSISPAIQVLWATVRLLVTRVSLIYLVDEFFVFSFLVLLCKDAGWAQEFILLVLCLV